MERLIFHIDVNSAFLSWEASKRVKNGEADLRNIPSAVGGDREKRTGIILAKSIPAKKYGIKTGEPVTMALRKCPSLIVVKPDFRLYSKCSREFMDICRKYAPMVEKFSIDECFLDMTGTQLIYPDPIKTAYDIKNEIRDTLGFTVNVGVGSNKLLAKMASDFEKPDKVHTLFYNEIEKKMWVLPVGDLFSVGGATAEKLIKNNIKTIGQLAKADIEYVKRIVGVKMGEHIHRFANGIDNSEVSDVRDEAKGYSNSVTLEEDIVSSEAAKPVLLALADSVASRLRADEVRTSCVCVMIRSNDFKNKSHQRKLYEPTDVTSEIYETAVELFDEMWKNGKPLRLIGISLTQITHEKSVQLSFFDDEKQERSRQLDRAVDSIRNKFGSDTVTRGALYNSGIRVGKKHKASQDEKNRIK